MEKYKIRFKWPKLVETIEEIKENIKTLDNYLEDPENVDYEIDRIKLGACFIVVNSDGGLKFYPSRFIGYKNNSRDMHEKNEEKDGRVTNVAIKKILGSMPEHNDELEEEYQRYCEKLGFRATKRKRKYWDRIL